MTVSQMAPAIGKQVYYVDGPLRFACVVKDVKMGYGNARFLVAPVSGFGEKWVELSHLEPITPPRINQPSPVRENAVISRLPAITQPALQWGPNGAAVAKKSWWK